MGNLQNPAIERLVLLDAIVDCTAYNDDGISRCVHEQRWGC